MRRTRAREGRRRRERWCGRVSSCGLNPGDDGRPLGTAVARNSRRARERCPGRSPSGFVSAITAAASTRRIADAAQWARVGDGATSANARPWRRKVEDATHPGSGCAPLTDKHVGDAIFVDARARSSVTVDAGTSVGRYVVLEEIRRTELGLVLRAYDPKLQREVALECVRSRAIGSAGARRLVAEA